MTPKSPNPRRPTQWKRLLLAAGIALASTVVFTPILEGLVGASPRRTGKLLLQLTFLGVLMLTARGRKGSFTEDTGLRSSGAARLWWTGFLYGAVSLGLFMVALTFMGERYMDGFQGWGHLAQYAAKYLPLSFIIGILEDVTFFGLLYAVCGGRFLPPVLVYAITHFIHDGKAPLSDSIQWHGLEVLSRMGTSLAGIVDHPTEAIGLALIGGVLLSIRIKTQSIWCSMGVHGGWYYARMLGRKFNKDLVGDHEWFFGTNRFCDGVLGWCIILSAGFLVHWKWNQEVPDKKPQNV